MRRSIARAAGLALVLFVSACSSGAASTPAFCAGPLLTGPEVEEIRRLELRGAQVNVDGWTIEEAQGFFAPEWYSVQLDGSRVELGAVLGRFRDGRFPGVARRFDLTDLDIRVYCDAAVVVGVAEAHGLGAGEATPPTRFRYMNIWRKGPAGWLYAAQLFYSPPAPD